MTQYTYIRQHLLLDTVYQTIVMKRLATDKYY